MITRDQLVKEKLKNRSNPVIKSLITTIIGECDRIDKSIDHNRLIKIIVKMHENNANTIKHLMTYEPTDRSMVAVLREENEYLQKYIPKQLSESEISEIVIIYCKNNDINRTDVLKNIGKIMSFFMDHYKDSYNGKVLRMVVERINNDSKQF